MANSPVLQNLKRNIVSQLEKGDLTTSNLRKSLPQVPNSSLYKALQVLQEEGRIRERERLAGRERLFTLGGDPDKSTLIPNLNFDNMSLSAMFFLDPENFEVQLNRLNQSIIYSLARIFSAADELEQGAALTIIDKKLRRIRLILQQSQSQLNDLFDLTQQILKDDRFWEPKSLAKYHQDPNWLPDKVESTLAYFTKENN